jgi:hypothetical protein
MTPAAVPSSTGPVGVSALRGLKPQAFILDGEVAGYDRALILRFEWLRRWPTDEPATLPVYMVFDLLELDGRDLRGEPLKVRRRLLERLLRSHGMIFAVRRLARDGLKAWKGRWPAGSRASSRRTPNRTTCRGGRSPGSRSSSRSTARASAGGSTRRSHRPCGPALV